MEDILVDYHLAKAMAQQSPDRDYQQALYLEAVLEKHGVTQAEFDSSLVYYYTRADRFEPIYKRVAERLEEQALVLGASEGEIGKYASFNAEGDTANIWADRSTAVLMPVPPYNRWDFAFEGDSTFHRGDSFLFQFTSDYMYQSGSKSGVLYMAVDYGDTVVSRNLHFSAGSLSQMNFPANDTCDIKRISGFFYLGTSQEAAATRLLFLSNVQLIRFHKEQPNIEPSDSLPSDSLAHDSIGNPLAPDSLRRNDSLKHDDLPLTIDTLTKPERIGMRHRQHKAE